MLIAAAVLVVLFFTLFVVILPSIRVIGPSEVGLVTKKFGRKITDDSPIAFRGEAGYQSALLMPGVRFKFWLIYSVEKHPWVQIPAGQIGVVVAQVGAPMEVGAKTAKSFGPVEDIADVAEWVKKGGQKGVQRPVLPPGTTLPVHPLAFLVITREAVYGVPLNEDLRSNKGNLSSTAFGLKPDQLEVTVIKPADDGILDQCAIVHTLEGAPLPPSAIAGRLGGFEDIAKLEVETTTDDATLVSTLLESKNNIHNNFQDFQKFLDNGGCIGLQHDVLLYGAYLLNPFLVRIERVPMLVVRQGEVAVIKAYEGLPTVDTSGATFKHGSLVRPGHRGIWQEPLRTGKYAVNPRLYAAEIVPTSIIALNWAEATSRAHEFDKELKPIVAKSSEGFIFNIDLVVQIHVGDVDAPRVISMVGSVEHLIHEVLQSAVGNHFRDRLQAMQAVDFIQKRAEVQSSATTHIKEQLGDFSVETVGVFIQDVTFPEELTSVLKTREIANQEKATYRMQQEAEQIRIEMEKTKGTADRQQALAAAEVQVEISTREAEAKIQQARGEAEYTSQTGRAKAAEVEAVGLARAEAYQKQADALGREGTTLVNVITQIAEGKVRIAPDVLTVSGGNGSGGMDTLMALGTKLLHGMTVSDSAHDAAAPAEAPSQEPAA